jgi:serine/threonine protein kinase
MSTPTRPTSDVPAQLEPELEPGTQVGEYRVEGKLGQGAFGTVYKAVHPLIGKMAAIKVLGRRFSADPEMLERFVAEARAVNQIRHRHIIDIFSFDQLADGRHYYVMEYLDGETLDALIDREHRVGVGAAIPILRAIGKALDAAHAKGITHRDLKPENIFLVRDPDGGDSWPKLLDFGIAKLMGPDDQLKHKTRTGSPIGTPYYMSPEQCRGRDVDHRTDYYAFGVLVYLMLTGVYPFDGDDYMTILMKQISDPPPPPSVYVSELAPLDDCVLWLLQKEPGDRPPDLRTAVRALEEAAVQAGLMSATSTSNWDAQTPAGKIPTQPPKLATQPPKLATQPPNLATARTTGLPGTPGGVGMLATMPSGGISVAEPPKPSHTGKIVVAALAAVVLGVGVFALARGGAADRKPPPAAPVVQAPVLAPIDAAPAVQAPVLAPVDAAPARPHSVIITVTGVPDGTDVQVGGASIGVAPGPVQQLYGVDAVVLVFKADGYVALSQKVVPDHDQELTVKLKKKAGQGTGKTPSKDDIIDVFGGKQ